jgi:transketolase
LPGNQEEFLHQYSNHWNDGYLNYFRLSESSHTVDLKEFKSGACHITNGERATVIVVGPLLQQAFDALKDLDLDILYLNNLNNLTLKELNGVTLKRDIIIIEPYYSGTVANLLIENGFLGYSRIHQIGVPREFLNNYGTASEHMAHLELDAPGIRSRVKRILND